MAEVFFKSAYLSLLQNLLPQGQAWTRDPKAMLTKVLGIIAGAFSDAHARALALLEEADPRTTFELLPEWENEHGLPDNCTGGNDTVQERRLALVQKIIGTGGQSRPYFKEVAAALGYDIAIVEHRPFICGISECGEGTHADMYGEYDIGITDILTIGHIWSVKVLGPRVTWFTCGESECGVDPMAKISRAEDLECILDRLKPAHTNLIFSYEGV